LELGLALPRCPLATRLVATDNRILIAGYRPAQKFVIERSSCAHRFGNWN